MIIKRFAAAATVLCLGLALGSCSPFSGFVADHWPRWAGGMPDDVPPRPGAPGYQQFIAHGESARDAGSTGAAGDKTDPQAVPAQGATAQTVSIPSAPVASAPPGGPESDGSPTAHGGLY
jgi:hypothetical protein